MLALPPHPHLHLPPQPRQSPGPIWTPSTSGSHTQVARTESSWWPSPSLGSAFTAPRTLGLCACRVPFWTPARTDWALSLCKVNPLATSKYRLSPVPVLFGPPGHFPVQSEPRPSTNWIPWLHSMYSHCPVPVKSGSPGCVPVETGPCPSTNWTPWPLPSTDGALAQYKLDPLAPFPVQSFSLICHF